MPIFGLGEPASCKLVLVSREEDSVKPKSPTSPKDSNAAMFLQPSQALLQVATNDSTRKERAKKKKEKNQKTGLFQEPLGLGRTNKDLVVCAD